MIEVVNFSGLIRMAVLFGAAFGIAAILIKIFPFLKKISWKIVVVFLVLSRIPDILVTILYFLKTGDIGSEANLLIRALYNWLSFTPLFFFANILAALPITLFLAWATKFLICEKVSAGYYLGYSSIIGSFLAVITNYLFVLRSV